MSYGHSVAVGWGRSDTDGGHVREAGENAVYSSYPCRVMEKGICELARRDRNHTTMESGRKENSADKQWSGMLRRKL